MKLKLILLAYACAAWELLKQLLLRFVLFAIGAVIFVYFAIHCTPK